jgi:hypothetical protein
MFRSDQTIIQWTVINVKGYNISLILTMAQVVIRRPLTAKAQVRAQVHVGFVVDKVALGQVFLRVLLFSPVNI